jgi:hypothetical protein
MLTKDAIFYALTVSNQAVVPLIDDMSDAPLTLPTPRGGNHPLWILGHLTWVEGEVPKILFGDESPVANWKPIFGIGTAVEADASKYPPFSDVRSKYDALFQANLKLFESLSEADLDQPTKWQPPGLEKNFTNYGLTFLTLSLHKMSHRGQLADARRAAGRKPLLM